MSHEKKYYTVEQMLRNLYGLQLSIKIMQKTIEELEREEHSLGAVDTTKENTGKTNKFYSTTESDAISTVERCNRLKAKIERNKRIIDLYYQALDVLNSDERKIIEMRYFEGKQWWQIAAEVHMSERNARYKRRAAIEKMIVVLDEAGELCPFFAVQTG